MLPCTELCNWWKKRTERVPVQLTNRGACRMHWVFQRTLLHQTLYIGDLMRNWCSRRAYLQFILTLWLGTIKENGAETVRRRFGWGGTYGDETKIRHASLGRFQYWGVNATLRLLCHLLSIYVRFWECLWMKILRPICCFWMLMGDVDEHQ